MAGLAALIMSTYLQSVFPATGAGYPPGYNRPILAFEFARTVDDLVAIFGPISDPQRVARLAAMHRGNIIDYLFMLLYGGFLASGCRALWHDLRRPILLLGIAMPILAALLDAWENYLLLAIQSAFVAGEPAPELAPELAWVTLPVTAKFLLLGLTNMVIGYALMLKSGRGWTMTGAVVIIAGAASIIALAAPATHGQALGLTIGLGWVVLVVTAGLTLVRRKNLAVTNG